MSTFMQPPRAQRPKLSLSTHMAAQNGAIRSLSMVETSSIAFNTLANAYAATFTCTASEEPLTAINTKPTQTPFRTGPILPETPVTAFPISPRNVNAMTSTPPLSAGPVDQTGVFSFENVKQSRKLSINTSIADITPNSSPCRLAETRSPARARLSPPTLSINTSNHPRAGSLPLPAPYVHPRSLHSILRNSPLPPSTAQLMSPRYRARRFSDKPIKKHVGYNTPLEQTIVNEKYTISHIDLLSMESPVSTASQDSMSEPTTPIDPFSNNNTRDGGMTPGPFEEMRRRMVSTDVNGQAVATPKRREKKRQWRWTIGQEEDETDMPEEEISGAIMAARSVQQMQKKARFSDDEDEEPLTAFPVSNPPILTMPSSHSATAISPAVSPCSIPSTIMLKMPTPGRNMKRPALSMNTRVVVPRTVLPVAQASLNQSPDLDMSDASSMLGSSAPSSVVGGDTDTDTDVEMAERPTCKTPVGRTHMIGETEERAMQPVLQRRGTGHVLL